MASPLIGQLAPSLSLPDADGHDQTLEALLRKGPVVVFFYPKNNTSGCTKEACGFRDAYEKFVAHGAEVVGISGDRAESHRAFRSQHKLPFLLLTDADGAAAKAWGVKKSLGLLPGRETFLVSMDGVVRHHVSGQLSVDRHVQETLRELKKVV
jgi:peroxiredoxin Q/BCP